MRESGTDNKLMDVGDSLGDMGIDNTVVPVHSYLQVNSIIVFFMNISNSLVCASTNAYYYLATSGLF